MKNREKFAKEILDIACSGDRIAMIKGENKLRPCEGLACVRCVFRSGCSGCNGKINEWCESEYEEPKITIPADTPVDTKILVSNNGLDFTRRYLAKIDGGKVYAWMSGATSWSTNDKTLMPWEYGKLAEESDGT